MLRVRYRIIVAIFVLGLSAAAGPVGCGGSPSPGGGASMTTTPDALSFPAAGSGALTQALTLDPSGWVVDRFQVVGSKSWLSATVAGQADPTTGVCDGLGNCSSISVTVDGAGLAPGTYTGAVFITPQYLDSCQGNATFNQYVNDLQSPMSVPVTFEVTAAAPVIQLSTNTLVFDMQAGSAAQTKAVTITNSGGGTLNWTATVTGGGSFLSLSSSGGAAPGSLSVTATPGTLAAASYTGSVRISASDGTAVSQDISVTMNLSAQPGAPVFAAGDVRNAASLAPEAILSPGGLVSLSGSNLAVGASVATVRPLPTLLMQTKVLIGPPGSQVAAPLFYVSPTRVYFQMPYGLSGSQAVITVVSKGISSAAANVAISPAVPGIFTLVSTSGGAAAVNQDGTVNSAANPAARGSKISIYATGLGETDPVLGTGQAGAASAPLNQTVITPQVTVGGSAAVVGVSCVAPNFIGLYQVNVTVPANTPIGAAIPVQIIANGNGSNVATIAVN